MTRGINHALIGHMTNNIETLARRYASARNQLFAAAMSDGSIESINRAERARDAARAELAGTGIDPDTAVVYDNDRGCYVIVPAAL